MTTKHTLKSIDLDQLQLDVNNPRFAELYSGSSKESDLIEYLLYSEAAEEVAEAIVHAGEFYPDRPLWVIKIGQKYLVKDGNRRCAAVKALQTPNKYKLSAKPFEFKTLPVVVYKDQKDLDERMMLEHTGSLFRAWERIAKALELYKLYKSGSSVDSMKEIDSEPTQLIKLADFYYEAVKVGGEDLRKFLRRGKGENGGKTIVFERMFKYSDKCGYTFVTKPSIKIIIKDRKQFDLYIKAMIGLLKAKANDITARHLDKQKDKIFNELKPYGFKVPKPKPQSDSTNTSSTDSTSSSANENSSSASGDGNGNNSGSETQGTSSSGTPRKSIKTKPIYQRKKIPPALDSLIHELYSLDTTNFSNAKMALIRVTFENTLKYVIENTKFDKKKNLCDNNYFSDAFNYNGKKRPFTDFTKLKTLFTAIIDKTGAKKAFEDFNLDRPHQIIHNYMVAAAPADTKVFCDNLMPLLEFMLQEEEEFLTSLDQNKLK